jgi:hypothetical protein
VGFDAAGGFVSDAFGNEGGFGVGSPPQVQAALVAPLQVPEEGAETTDEYGKLWRMTGGEWRPALQQSWVRH